MKLFYSTTSPYARKCHIALYITERIQKTELVAINPFNDQSYRQINPLGKLPSFQHENQIFADSPLICEYLDSLYVSEGNPSIFNKGTDKYFFTQRLHGQADGILDAAVNTIMETRRETQHSDMWLERWRTSIQMSIENLNMDELIDSGDASIATITWASALGYLDFRLDNLGWRTWNKALADWLKRLENNTWYQATRPVL